MNKIKLCVVFVLLLVLLFAVQIDTDAAKLAGLEIVKEIM